MPQYLIIYTRYHFKFLSSKTDDFPHKVRAILSSTTLRSHLQLQAAQKSIRFTEACENEWSADLADDLSSSVTSRHVTATIDLLRAMAYAEFVLDLSFVHQIESVGP